MTAKNELLQIMQDFSEQYGETYEQRCIYDNEFGELADVIIKKSDPQWIKIESEDFATKPLCYQTGDWDGKRSDRFLVELIDGNYVIARCYETQHNGESCFDWYYDIEEYELKESEIRRWMKIPY